MRQIKFRAWDNIGKKMLLVGVIHFDQVGGLSFIKGQDTNGGILNSFELMQFTGLFDKNGKEIWEGDVVVQDIQHTWHDSNSNRHDEDIEQNHGVVKYDDSMACFMVGNYRLFPDELIMCQDCEEVERPAIEVLGNIYENQELLK